MEAPLVYDVQQQHVSLRARVPLMFGALEARPEGRINMDDGQYRYRSTLCACVGPQLRSGQNGSRLRMEAGVGASSDNNDEGFLTIGVRKVTEHLWNARRTAPSAWPPHATPEAVQQLGWRMQAAAHIDWSPDMTKLLDSLDDSPEDINIQTKYLSRRAFVSVDCGSWLTGAARRQEQLVVSAGAAVDWPMAKGRTYWGAPVTSKPQVDPFVHIQSPIGLGLMVKKRNVQLTFQL